MIYSVLGSHGFIGRALSKRLIDNGHTVYPFPHKDAHILFHFASPSSNIIFNNAQDYCIEETIISFLNVIRFCREHKIKLIYPSSATVYCYDRNNYANTKASLECIHQAYGGDMLGLRIFAGYGVGEEHKGEYSSIVYQFCQKMLKGERPIIFGDGTQTRDFIYISDIVDTILCNTSKQGFIDVGTGVSTSFNDIVKIINDQLNTNIEPIYKNKPNKYVQDTICIDPIRQFINVNDGIKYLLTSLRDSVA